MFWQLASISKSPESPHNGFPLTRTTPSSFGTLSSKLSEPNRRPLLLYTITMISTRNPQTKFRKRRTAKPQSGIRPAKQKSAPKARALKISDPRRIPPSIPIFILFFAIGAHSRRASRLETTPSSCRPPWLEIRTPSTPCKTARETSSGVVTAV